MSERSYTVSRRRFLAGAVSAGIGAPMIARRSVFGGEDRAAPSERIAVGLIGVGKQANGYHLGTLLGFGDVEIVGICDVDTTRREHARRRVNERYGRDGDDQACPGHNDFRELVARDDVDAVLIATPDHWHAIPVIEACKAGKDVYCEEPLSLTIREGRAMVEAVRNHGRVFQTGSQLRSGGSYAHYPRACELIRSGRLGKVRRVYVSVGGPSRWCDLGEESMEPGLDWDLWLGQAPKRPYHSVLSPRGVPDHWPMWRSYREYSGGGMTDIGAHEFDIVQWALGRDGSGPVEICPPDDPDATQGLKFVYDDGVELIHGGPGGIVFEGTDGKISLKRSGMVAEPEEVAKEPLGADEVHLYKSPGHHRDWIECIGSRKRPVCDVEIGVRSVTVCHLANLAYWNRRRLRWDPQREQFVGDAVANTWLDRERRDPWQLPPG